MHAAFAGEVIPVLPVLLGLCIRDLPDAIHMSNHTICPFDQTIHRTDAEQQASPTDETTAVTWLQTQLVVCRDTLSVARTHAFVCADHVVVLHVWYSREVGPLHTEQLVALAAAEEFAHLRGQQHVRMTYSSMTETYSEEGMTEYRKFVAKRQEARSPTSHVAKKDTFCSFEDTFKYRKRNPKSGSSQCWWHKAITNPCLPCM